MSIPEDIHSIPSVISALGMRLLPSSQEGIVVATMPVDERTIQPYGVLSGGASLALAETLAGYGSFLLCQPDEFPSGISVSASHLAAVPAGQIVQATGTLLHKGQTTHVWNIDIVDEQGKLVSTARVTNMILRKKQ